MGPNRCSRQEDLRQCRGTTAESAPGKACQDWLQTWLPALAVGAGPGSGEVASGQAVEKEQPETEAAAQGKGQLFVF